MALELFFVWIWSVIQIVSHRLRLQPMTVSLRFSPRHLTTCWSEPCSYNLSLKPKARDCWVPVSIWTLKRCGSWSLLWVISRNSNLKERTYRSWWLIKLCDSCEGCWWCGRQGKTDTLPANLLILSPSLSSCDIGTITSLEVSVSSGFSTLIDCLISMRFVSKWAEQVGGTWVCPFSGCVTFRSQVHYLWLLFWPFSLTEKPQGTEARENAFKHVGKSDFSSYFPHNNYGLIHLLSQIISQKFERKLNREDIIVSATALSP